MDNRSTVRIKCLETCVKTDLVFCLNFHCSGGSFLLENFLIAWIFRVVKKTAIKQCEKVYLLNFSRKKFFLLEGFRVNGFVVS